MYFERRRMELNRSQAFGHPSIRLGLLGNELRTGASNWPINILAVDKRSIPELVILQNVRATSADLTGWAVASERQQQLHCCQQGIVLAPGEIRLFPHQGPGPIFEDTLCNDVALYDSNETLISAWVDW